MIVINLQWRSGEISKIEKSPARKQNIEETKLIFAHKPPSNNPNNEEVNPVQIKKLNLEKFEITHKLTFIAPHNEDKHLPSKTVNPENLEKPTKHTKHTKNKHNPQNPQKPQNPHNPQNPQNKQDPQNLIDS